MSQMGEICPKFINYKQIRGKMKTKVSKVKYDENTGEIFSDKEFIYTEDDKIIGFKQNSPFTKTFMNMSPKFKSISFMGYFYLICHKIQRHTNVIVKKEDGVTLPMSKEDIADLFGITIRTTNRFLLEANKISAIAKAEVNNQLCYVINPTYAYNGGGISSFLFLLFQHDKNFLLFVTGNQVNQYNKLTGDNYYKHLKKNFPEIYDKIKK